MNIELEEVPDITSGEIPFIRFLLRDVREAGDVEDLFASLPRLSALRVVCKELGLPRDLAAMIHECTEKARSLIFQETFTSKGYKPWLFIAHGYWVPDNRITRYKKLWRKVEEEYGAGTFRRGPEVEFASQEGLRYATVTELLPENFLAGVTLLRKNADSTLLLTQRQNMETEEAVRDLFDAVFLKEDGSYESSVGWAYLVAKRCPLGEILVKAGGSWDEREYYLEFLGLPERLSLLAQKDLT